MDCFGSGATRRAFLALAAGGVAALALSGCAGVRRRTRRRTRRRVRRRVAWRMVGARRVIVVPVDLEAGDELEFEDGRVGTVIDVQAENVVVNVGGERQTLPAAFEGEIGYE
jgi:hypothetical protein